MVKIRTNICLNSWQWNWTWETEWKIEFQTTNDWVENWISYDQRLTLKYMIYNKMEEPSHGFDRSFLRAECMFPDLVYWYRMQIRCIKAELLSEYDWSSIESCLSMQGKPWSPKAQGRHFTFTDHANKLDHI